MRDPVHVCVVAATLKKKLGQEVSILQGEKYTEWRLEDGRGFAIGPYITSYPLAKLAEKIEQYLKGKK